MWTRGERWMSTEPKHTDLIPDPPAEWRRDWEEHVRRAAPAQLNFDHGGATTYWGSRAQARRAAVVANFGRWPTVVIDTVVVFLSVEVLALVMSAIVLFVIALNGPTLAHGGSISEALSHASATEREWLSTPPGIAVLALASQAGLLLTLQLRVVLRGLLSWADIGFGPALRRAPLRALALGVGIGLLAFVVGEVLLAIMNEAGLDVREQANSLQSVRHAPIAQVIPFVLTTVFTAPLAEEAFFRGYMLRALTVRYGLAAGLGISSILFALLHLLGGVGWDVVPLFVVGVLLGWAYARTGNLLTDITAHAVNNLIGVLILYHG
jgi:membrane protease YdiL (CAAX protease family)